MLKNKRTVAIITSIVIFCTLIFSLVFIVAESNHDCAGEQCTICHTIQICEQTLKLVGTAVFVSAILALLVFGYLRPISSVHDGERNLTLVSLKVKLTY